MVGAEVVFAAYTTLLEKVDRRIAQVPPCACPAGCDRCCRVSFTLFPVEAFHLRGAYLRLPPAVAERVARRALAVPAGDCPFLLDGRCAVYASRPVLCRLHGYPFVLRGREEDTLEIHPGCERLPLESLPVSGDGGSRKVSAQDLDGINGLLAAVNDVFCRCAGLGARGPYHRIAVSEIPAPRFPGGEHHADL